MKRLFIAAAAIIAACSLWAQTPDQVRIYLNPGHGSWGPNDRPMATIPYPALPSTGRPDTCGFYESNTNLWKILRMGQALENMGVDPNNIMYSRVKNGPYPYVAGAPDAEIYNRNLTEIAREVDANNMDIFVSIHSNAATDGTSTNYPLFLYRGQDYSASGYEHNEGSYEMCDATWGPHYMDELDPQSHYSRTQKNIRGDWNFYGSTYETTTSQGTFVGYLGVLRHGTPGFLMEGYFHTYQPARHRALNSDYCGQEGVRTARGLCDYFGLNPEPTGYIMGTIKDKHLRINNSLYTYANGTDDQWMPLNGAEVRLLKDGVVVDTYQVDQNYNGIFVFEGLEPGTYTLDASLEGYDELAEEYKGELVVAANATTYAKIYLSASGYLTPETFYLNYPEPTLPEGTTLPATLEFTAQKAATLPVEGTVRRTIVRGDSTYVLTNVGTQAHIYIINNDSQQVVGEVPTSTLHTETDNLGFYSALSDITFSADGVLVGVNSVRCQSGDSNVDTGYKRGSLYFYRWDNIDEEPSVWITTENSASCYRADMGQSFAIAGTTSNCTIVTTALNVSNNNIRLLVMKYYDGQIENTYYTERTASAAHPFKTDYAGSDYRVTLSATDDTHLGDDGLIVNANNFVLDGELIAPHEIALASSITNSTDLGTIGSALADVDATALSFFRYAGHTLMVLPTIADGMVTGVKVLDVGNGFADATEVPALGATLPEAIATEHYMGTGASVNGTDIDLFLTLDNELIRFTRTADVLRGDLDGNGTVDVVDVNLCINVLLTESTEGIVGNPDLDGNGSIDVDDLNAILNIVLAN